MVSLIILTILFLFLLSNNFKSIVNNNEILISNLITSLLLSISLIGIISIGLIFFQLTKLPIILFTLLVTFFYGYFYKLNFYNIGNFKNSLKLIFNIFLNNSRNWIWTILVMLWLYFISLGPINHPDAITTYLGYPKQFYLQNKHFIDGGLHQGLLGLCDFANLSFLQEHNTWLIRSIQSFPIALLVSVFIIRKRNKILIFTFLTSPVFIQWLTIGKYLFLPDISIVITYLVWTKFKDKNSLLNLIIVIFLSLSFKVSCLIISFPIVVHVSYDFLKNRQFLLKYSRDNLLRFYLLIFAIFALLSILIYRFFVTGNPFYPIFNSYFISDNPQMIYFENFLRGFMRREGFPFNLIMTSDVNSFGMILGPATGFCLISIPIINRTLTKKIFISETELVAISQIVLLLTLSQGRADYFSSPIIILILENNFIKENFSLENLKISKNYLFKRIFQSLLVIQILIFLTITSISGYQTIYSFIDNESYMNRYSFNYQLTNILNNYSKEPIMSLGDRTALLFLKKNYIHEDNFKKCINYGVQKDQSVSNCISKLNPNSVITFSNEQEIYEGFKCKKYAANRTSRNPFNLKKRIFHICNKSKT
tara:strand:+ start:502 stop:2283 length:1782 start_codon:yes stop_codon:yes gene_type:complete